MFTQGIYPIGDGLLDIDETRLKGLIVQDDINEIYDVEQTPFARGKFAAVRRAIHKNSGVHFAAKFLKRRRRAQSSDKEIKHEIAVLMLCDGADNIVKLNAVHESRSDTALLLELATGGELQTFLDNEECLTEAQTRICMREVLKALQFLHNRSIAHLDLKPQNILLAGEHIEDGLKLCDFGISRVVAEGTNVREIVGTPDYVAPEVLQYEPLSLLTDIWSVGVLAYVLLSGFSPFGGDTKQETFLNISQCALTFPDKLFGSVSASAIDFIRRALRIKPCDRMTAAGCLEHVWLKDESSIDRQLLSNMTKTASAAGETDLDDESFEEDEDDDDDDDEDDRNASDIGNALPESNEICNGHAMDSFGDGGTKPKATIKQNGSPTTTNTSASIYANYLSGSEKERKKFLTKSEAGNSAMSKKGGSTIISIPATRATTIPLSMHVVATNHHQSQLLHSATRRHSSDVNKENSFRATKMLTVASNSATMPQITTTPTTTATTLVIGSTSTTAIPVAGNRPLVSTITLSPTARAGSMERDKINDNNTITITVPNSPTNSAICCIFPDAPTTPKVIRKTPTTDTSSTSVKALVKKFQLEVGGSSNNNNSNTNICNIDVPSCAVTTGLIGGGGAAPAAASAVQVKDSTSRTRNISNAGQRRSSSANNAITVSVPAAVNRANDTKTTNLRKSIVSTTCSSSSCSSSLPSETVHTQRTAVTSPLNKTNYTASEISGAPVSATSACHNFKSTCVLCLSCGSAVTTIATSTNGVNSSTGSNCKHSTTVTTPSGKNTNNSAAAAILLSNHKQLQHHHHHHHHHQKSTGNNLSLDQGIIC